MARPEGLACQRVASLRHPLSRQQGPVPLSPELEETPAAQVLWVDERWMVLYGHEMRNISQKHMAKEATW
jgi:hypothetical protein